jgi:hypothetical protein
MLLLSSRELEPKVGRNWTAGLGNREGTVGAGRDVIRAVVTPMRDAGRGRFPRCQSIILPREAMSSSVFSSACQSLYRPCVVSMTSEELVATLASAPGARRLSFRASFRAAGAGRLGLVGGAGGLVRWGTRL